MTKSTKKIVSTLFAFTISISITLSTILFNQTKTFAAPYDDWTLSDCYTVADFVTDNFDTFVSEYNKTVVSEAEKLQASSIENVRFINLVEDNNYGVYLDFNDNNGYAVITGNYTIYALEVSGDLQDLNDIDDLCYSYLDGFCIQNDDGTHTVLQQQSQTTILNDSTAANYNPAEGYTTLGTIYNLESYISSHYNDYSYYNNVMGSYEPDLEYLTGLQTSFYVSSPLDENKQYLNYGRTGEGNCALTAMTNILSFWGHENLINIDYLTSLDLYSSGAIYNDVLYNDYGRNNIRTNLHYDSSKPVSRDNAPYLIWNVNQDDLYNMSMLYQDVRTYCIYTYNYTPESGFSPSNVPDVLETIVENFDYANTTEISVQATTSATDVGNALLKGRASYVSILGHPVYENHGSAIVDMYIYSYKEGWWIFATEKHAYFYEIVDGWGIDEETKNDTGHRYLDPNANDGSNLTFYVWIG